ncbi:MAG: hypothetical protein HY586_00505, partial [Candidatus Omnitrophica bacterium]|nr:hypothetical protein [Candidatus Omnitrophota bacterium]
GGEEQIKRDIAAGFLMRKEGQLWAPIIRNPAIERYPDIHGRSMWSFPYQDLDLSGQYQTTVCVLKGAGLHQAINGVPFYYDNNSEEDSGLFRGGHEELSARHEAQVALDLHREFATALDEGDPHVLKAVGKYGITELPLLRPRYLLRPLKIPVLLPGKKKPVLIEPEEALKRAGVPKAVRKQQIVFVYNVPVNRRIDEIHSQIGYYDEEGTYWTDSPTRPAVNAMDKYYPTNPGVVKLERKDDILTQFAARFALVMYLAHRRLNYTFGYWGADGTIRTSITFQNTTISGHTVDLESVRTGLPNTWLVLMQQNDLWNGYHLISDLAKKLDAAPTRGGQTFDGVYFGDVLTWPTPSMLNYWVHRAPEWRRVNRAFKRKLARLLDGLGSLSRSEWLLVTQRVIAHYIKHQWLAGKSREETIPQVEQYINSFQCTAAPAAHLSHDDSILSTLDRHSAAGALVGYLMSEYDITQGQKGVQQKKKRSRKTAKAAGQSLGVSMEDTVNDLMNGRWDLWHQYIQEATAETRRTGLHLAKDLILDRCVAVVVQAAEVEGAYDLSEDDFTQAYDELSGSSLHDLWLDWRRAEQEAGLDLDDYRDGERDDGCKTSLLVPHYFFSGYAPGVVRLVEGEAEKNSRYSEQTAAYAAAQAFLQQLPENLAREMEWMFDPSTARDSEAGWYAASLKNSMQTVFGLTVHAP